MLLSEAVDAIDTLVKSRPNGVTLDEIVDHLDMRRNKVENVINHYRRRLGNTGFNLPCSPDFEGDPTGQWIYELVSKDDTENPRMKWWLDWMKKHSVTRLRSQVSMTSSWVNATDGRTEDGKEARTMLRRLEYLLAEISAI